jgi:hypothetical protein
MISGSIFSNMLQTPYDFHWNSVQSLLDFNCDGSDIKNFTTSSFDEDAFFCEMNLVLD